MTSALSTKYAESSATVKHAVSPTAQSTWTIRLQARQMRWWWSAERRGSVDLDPAWSLARRFGHAHDEHTLVERSGHTVLVDVGRKLHFVAELADRARAAAKDAGPLL